MFPYLRLGPFLLQMPLLALLVGLLIGLTLAEREAAALQLKPAALANAIFYSLLAALIGARLGYALQFPALYTASPLSLLALTPTTLSPLMGATVGLVTFMILMDRKGLPLRPTLDALAPGLTFVLMAVGVSHILSGDAYGAPARVPWAIRLWNDYRHPSQFYETLSAAIIFLIIRERLPKPDGAGLNFLLAVVLSAAARVFLEAFRGDSVFWPGGFREAQVLALAILMLGLYWMRRWMNPAVTPNAVPDSAR